MLHIKQTDGTELLDTTAKDRRVNGKSTFDYMKAKQVGGFGTIEISVDQTKEVTSMEDFWNLVVFLGREFVASKVSSLTSGSQDNTNRKIAYFGVGSGGADTEDSSVRFGPTLDDEDLRDPKKFSDSEINTSSNGYLYMKDGYLKKIDSDSAIIESETHEYTNADGDTVSEDRLTVVHYTLTVEQDEMLDDTFTFNEAGLYTIEYDDDGNPKDGTEQLFARLTSSNKDKEREDSIKIEWFILT